MQQKHKMYHYVPYPIATVATITLATTQRWEFITPKLIIILTPDETSRQVIVWYHQRLSVFQKRVLSGKITM